MKRARMLARIVALIYILSLLPSAVFAQELAGRIAGSPAQTSAATGNPDALKTHVDNLTGKNTRGPYNLSWKGIEHFGERVLVDGNMMQRGLDYTADYEAGMIAFESPVAGGSAVRVEYTYDPSKAKSNTSPLSVPLTLDLVRRPDKGLQLIGLYKQADPNNKSASDLMVYGLSGLTKGKDSEISSLFLFSQDRSEQGKQNDISFGDSSALQTGGQLNTGALKLSTSFTHVGAQFAAAPDYKLQRGLDALDISAVLALSPSLNLTSVVKRTESSFGDKKGQKDASAVSSLVYDTEGAPKLTVTHSETEKAKPGAAEVATTTNKVAVEHKLDTGLSAAVSSESVKTVTGGSEAKTDTEQISVNYKPTDNTTVSSKFVDKDSSKDGKESVFGINVDSILTKTLSVSAAMSRANSDKSGEVDAESVRLLGTPNSTLGYELNLGHRDTEVTGSEFSQGIKINASPVKWITAKAAVSRTDAEKTGENNAESLALVVSPSQLLNLEMNLAHKDTTATGNELTHMVKVVSALRPNLRVELATMGKDVERSEDELSHTAQVSTTVVKNTTLQLNWGEKESDTKGSERSRNVRVETAPTKTIKFSGGLGQKETASARETSTEAQIALSPYDHTKLGGGIKQVQSNGEVVSRITDLSASTKPVDYFEFSGIYRLREALEKEDLDSLNLALLLDTGSLVKLTGAYTSNPEDKKGAVQRINSQSIGLRTDFGRLEVKSALTYKDEYLVGKRSETIEFGFDYRLSSHALLTSSYSVNEYMEASALATEIYAVGYTHKVGSRLNLYLGGKMTNRTNDASPLDDGRDYEAEARLGLKF